jgi:8-oxo-dGTP pyrophosphatase MutT (NUDIX family)
MKKSVLKGEWYKGTTWEFIISEILPTDFPVTAVTGFAYIDNKIILTKTHRGWELPGGHVEDGETLSEALRREMKEEAGINIKTEKLFGYLRIHNSIDRYSKSTGKKYPEYSYILYYFTIFEGCLGECIGDDALESKAFDLSDPKIQGCENFERIRIAHALFLDKYYFL